MGWATFAIFVLGIANFAMGKAVFESGHPLFARLPRASQLLSRRASFFTEFVVLCLALALSVEGWPGLALAYAGYTALNALATWLVLTGRL